MLPATRAITIKFYKMKPENLLNWGELSRLLSGNRFTVRKNKVPVKYQDIVSKLLSTIKNNINLENRK